MKIALAAMAVLVLSAPAFGQEKSSSTVIRRGARTSQQEQQAPGVTARMQQRLQETPVSDADLSWMKVIYRSLDLTKNENAPLYFPEMPVDGNESLIRIILRLLSNNQISAYEYLDGREVFTEETKLKVKDMLDQYQIYYQLAKGSTEKNPKYVIHESDVPATEVLSYYIIERWEFDTRTNGMKTRIEAVCPVLHRDDEYGMEAMKYPMFWVKYDDLRPYLSTQNIFVSDANNLPTYTYADYFTLGLYKGEIYKTRNLRNRSMKQLYPNPEDMARAQDSIQQQLDKFEEKLWVPSLEELEAKRKALEEKADSASTEVAKSDDKDSKKRVSTSSRGKSKSEAKPAKVKKEKKSAAPKSASPQRSVRNRKR